MTDPRPASTAPAPAPIPKGAVLVTAQDLQGPGAIACPNPKMPLWSNHPKVYLDVATTGQARCPYCSTVYALPPGMHVSGH